MNQFTEIPIKHIILYTDNEYYENILKTLYSLGGKINIISLLKTNEPKLNKQIPLIEIYYEDESEKEYLSNATLIIYVSKYKKSNILLNFLENNNKQVFYNIETLDNDIINFFQNENYEINNQSFISYYKSLLEYNKINYPIENENIKLKITKESIKNPNEKISFVTIYRTEIDTIRDLNNVKMIQKKCIVENLNNKYIDKYLIIGNNLEEELKEIIEKYKHKLILYHTNKELNYKELFETINIFFKESIICLLRCDIILPNQNTLDTIDIDMFDSLINKKEIFALSRIERLLNGNLIKNDKLIYYLYSNEQDAWLFYSPIELNEKSFDKLSTIHLYDINSHLYFNKIMIDNNYKIINNSKKYKIIRLLYNFNIVERFIMNEKLNNIEYNDLYLLPSNEYFDKLTIENLLKIAKIENNDDLYEIKCYIFNKYLKNKIINNIIDK